MNSQLESVYFQFLHSRLLPLDQKKLLLELGVDEAIVDEALELFYRQTGRILEIVPPHMLVEKKKREDEWYPGADNIAESKFWPALKRHLIDGKGWDGEAVNSIHQASNKIVGWLASPSAPYIKTRGLVVGYVQSGKTANFTAVIAKAADAGYRFFIVLSGTKNSLRQQTQKRLESELVSLNSEYWLSPTEHHDFRPLGNVNAYLGNRSDLKVLCVVKKNTTILRKLYKWLSGANASILNACPFLIIDDEADEASVNTSRYQVDYEGAVRERSAINRRIVDILSILPKAAYVGYTATPFANVLIDPSYEIDLYPKDFIVSLPKPEHHFGTERIFGRDRLLDDDDQEFVGLDMVRIIPDDEVPELKPVRNDHSFFPSITQSLETALAYFWMSCAARIVRGHRTDDMTMLIHTTQLIRVHENTKQVVVKHRNWILNLLKSNDGYEYVDWMEKIWNYETDSVSELTRSFNNEQVTFEQLKAYLLPVIEYTKIVTDNSQSIDRLTYDDRPKIQIAIGGNTLSRGLTLEGLVVSFFVRAAGAYDTLLQMGRWFGYRPGYEDLPRIWMTSQLEQHFHDLATIEAEIREDIKEYDLTGQTPREFGIRIRTHPDLNITAPLKMQFAIQAQVSFDNSVQQTVLFNHKNDLWLRNNLRATNEFISKLEGENYEFSPHEGHFIAFNIPSQFVIEFFGNYQFHENNRALQSNNLIGYVEDQLQHEHLTHWNIIIRGIRDEKTRDERRKIQLGKNYYPLLERSRRKYQDEHAHIGVLISRGDIGADIQKVALREYQGKGSQELRKLRLEEYPDTGLLLIYPVDKDSQARQDNSKKVDLEAREDMIGLGLVFPPAKGASRGAQTYMTVNLSSIDKGEFEVDEEDDEEA